MRSNPFSVQTFFSYVHQKLMIYGVNVRYVFQVREHETSRTRVTQLPFLLLEVFSFVFSS